MAYFRGIQWVGSFKGCILKGKLHLLKYDFTTHLLSCESNVQTQSILCVYNVQFIVDMC